MTAPALQLDIGNQEFLSAIFDDLRASEYLWTAQFKTSPTQAKAVQWSGLEVTDGYLDRNPNHQGWNHYYCVSSLKPAQDGDRARRKECFARLHVVVLDDAKILPQIEPTYVLETSPGKVQVGYRLVEPIEDLDLAVSLHKALAAAGHLGADTNGNNPVRYVRLPWGCNTKYSGSPAHVMRHWAPKNRITASDLIDGLGLVLGDSAPQSIRSVPVPSLTTPDGWMPKARKLAFDSARRTHDEPGLGRHNEIFRMGAYAARDGLPIEALEFMLQTFVPLMRACDTSGVITGINWDAERKTIKDGYRQGIADGIPAPVDASALIETARAKRDAEAFERMTGMSFEEANRRIPAPEILPETLPESRTFPVGGLDELAEWISSGASVAYPSITQQAVLSLASIAVARLYTTPQGDPLSLYLGCCGRSVGELRYAHHAVQQAMSAAGLRRMVRSTRMTSPATIYKSLLRSPATLYLSDDYGGVAAFSKRQPSGLQEHALSLVSSLYDGKNVQLDGPEDAGLRAGSGQVVDEQPVIFSPCLSVLALIGTDQLATLMRSSETGRGALQQMLFALADERLVVEQDPQQTEPPVWLPEYLRRLRRAPHPEQGVDLNLADIFSGLSSLLPQQLVIPFESPLQPIYAALDDVSSDRRVRSMLLSARGIVRRIAAVLAAWHDPDHPRVTSPILEWTGAYVVDRMRETIEQFEILHSTDGRSSVYDQVLAAVTKARGAGISNRDLCRECWGYRGLSGEKRGELVALMLDDEAIVEVSTFNPQTKRKSTVFVAKKFVKGEE